MVRRSMTHFRSVQRRRPGFPARARWFAPAAVLLALVAVLVSPRLSAAAPASEKVDPCNISGATRVVGIGDVHGAFEALTSILQAAGLVDNQLRWSGGQAHLVQMGDLVDRGPEARKVIDLLMRLEGEAEAAGGRVHALLGNHEVAVMLGDWRSSSPEEFEEFRTTDSEGVRERVLEASLEDARRQAGDRGEKFDAARFREAFLAKTPLGWLERRVAFGPNGKYGKWMRQLPAVARVNGVLFVHGGISPEVASLGCPAINARVHADLTKDIDRTLAKPLESLVARADGPLWYRGLAQMPDPSFRPAVEAILSRMEARAIVSGHSVVAGGRITSRFGSRVYLIDTGMLSAVYQGGRPSAIEFTEKGVTAIYLDGRAQPVDRDASLNGG